MPCLSARANGRRMSPTLSRSKVCEEGDAEPSVAFTASASQYEVLANRRLGRPSCAARPRDDEPNPIKTVPSAARGPDRADQRALQIGLAEGLLDNWPVTKRLADAGAAIARGEDERQIALRNRLGHRVDRF